MRESEGFVIRFEQGMQAARFSIRGVPAGKNHSPASCGEQGVTGEQARAIRMNGDLRSSQDFNLVADGRQCGPGMLREDGMPTWAVNSEGDMILAQDLGEKPPEHRWGQMLSQQAEHIHPSLRFIDAGVEFAFRAFEDGRGLIGGEGLDVGCEQVGRGF